MDSTEHTCGTEQDGLDQTAYYKWLFTPPPEPLSFRPINLRIPRTPRQPQELRGVQQRIRILSPRDRVRTPSPRRCSPYVITRSAKQSVGRYRRVQTNQKSD